MVKQYLKQALYMLKENRFVSVISIAGTAISIAMIMVVVLVFQVQFASFYPENNRDRMMYVDGGTEVRSDNGWNRGNMLAEAVKECFYTLQIPGSRLWLCVAVEAVVHSGQADVQGV